MALAPSGDEEDYESESEQVGARCFPEICGVVGGGGQEGFALQIGFYPLVHFNLLNLRVSTPPPKPLLLPLLIHFKE